MTAVRYVAANDAEIAAWLAERIGAALAAHPAGISVCLPGGSTPQPILAILARRMPDWRRIAVWPGDDRIVPPGHPAGNLASNLERIRAILEPAGAHCTALSEDARPPQFALTWLGMGEDGHVASLFPSSDPRPGDPAPVRRIAPDPLPPEAPFERLSLTIPALLDCDELLFVIRGAGKRAVFEAAARGESDLPVARLLAAWDRPVTCFV